MILDIVSRYLEKYPDMRFHQALQNLNINKRSQGDRFFEESKETYNNLRNESNTPEGN